MSVCRHCAKAGTWLALAENPATLPHVAEGARVQADNEHRNCQGNNHCDCQHSTAATVLRKDRKPDPRRGG